MSVVHSHLPLKLNRIAAGMEMMSYGSLPRPTIEAIAKFETSMETSRGTGTSEHSHSARTQSEVYLRHLRKVSRDKYHRITPSAILTLEDSSYRRYGEHYPAIRVALIEAPPGASFFGTAPVPTCNLITGC
jgi:hypothetical protein